LFSDVTLGTSAKNLPTFQRNVLAAFWRKQHMPLPHL